MSGQITLRVLSPSKVVAEEQVDFVVLRTVEGDMGVLPGHTPFAVRLDYGVLKGYVDKEEAVILALMGGFATVGHNGVTVLSPLAAPPDKLDDAFREIEEERARYAAEDKRSELEIQRAEMALRRALVKTDTSTHAVLQGLSLDGDAGEAGRNG